MSPIITELLAWHVRKKIMVSCTGERSGEPHCDSDPMNRATDLCLPSSTQTDAWREDTGL